jgi:hypothetical protein
MGCGALFGCSGTVSRLIWWRWLHKTEAGLVHAACACVTLRLMALGVDRCGRLVQGAAALLDQRHRSDQSVAGEVTQRLDGCGPPE